jgi:hypothetical protein
MANKMISGDHLRDEFLSELIRSDEPVRAPDGFMDEVMNRISRLPAVKKATPYQAPAWLKWGIPGVILASLLALLIWGPAKESGMPRELIFHWLKKHGTQPAPGSQILSWR